MSEFSAETLTSLATHLVVHGVPEPWACDLVALNASCPVIESGQWVLLDLDGQELVRVPKPSEFG
ncbi:MAG: hypothetical protein JNL97_11245 [Verrucomicrobiales bacterium]|nr:hypothetical protein [Verrucomicrobiales bacterium]